MKVLRLFLICWCVIFSTEVRANIVHSPHLDAELISENQSIQPGKKFWLAVRLQLEKEWHVYWENPGDSGLPTKILWELPSEFTAGKILWPIPERIEAPPLVNYGFDGDVLLLTEISAPANLGEKKNIAIEANVSWLVCRQECIPGKAKLVLDLPISNTDPLPNSWKIAFDSARSHTPKLIPVTSEIRGDKIYLSLPQKFSDARVEFFPLDEPSVAGLSEQVLTVGEAGSTLQLTKAQGMDQKLSTLRGLLVAKQKNTSEVYSVASSISEGHAAPNESIWIELLFAFLGGLILNFMPCVFPVLSMKILAVTNARSTSIASMRRHGLFYAFGVLFSFWILALLLVIAKNTGQGLGWGFQLQSPGFVASLALLFFMIGLNFLGSFEFGSGLMGVGSGLANKEGVWGDFFTGILAVVVASPCSAPFMGTAIGFALTAPIIENFLIFTFLGLGLAIPYLLLSFSPKALTLLPKPGLWMVRLKEFFAFPMFLTVIWLLWVFAQQSGTASSFLLLLALFLLSLLVLVLRTFSKSLLRNLMALLCLIGVLLSVFYFAPKFQTSASQEASSEWKPYSTAAVESELTAGEPVFIDFTAAWCLTCQVNERLVLGRPEIRDLLHSAKVKLFRADWTNKDPAITAALEKVGRAGVPVYLAYPRGKKDPQILPQLLTVDAVRSVFNP